MRVPAPDELAGGAHGTARAPSGRGRAASGLGPAPFRHRDGAGSRSASAAAALVAAVGVGTWAATSGDDAGANPQDTKNSAPSSP